jgi:AcrR family transcriptional regulator
MPPGRKPTRSQDEFVEAAITYADIQGIDALTLRDLGRSMGASATAVYRYFPDKEALYSAMRDALLARSVAQVDVSDEPRELITNLALAFRDQARRHPCLSQLMIVSRLQGPAAQAVPTVVGGALAKLGLHGEELAVAYRQFESFVVGTTVFDFSGAPQHLADRGDRMRAAQSIGFDVTLADDQAVERVNEAAFVATLTCLLDLLVAKAGT